MCISLSSGNTVELALGRGRVLGFDTPGPTLIACEQGSLWVTGPSSGDVVLDAHQRLTLNGPGRVVVQALDTARFCIGEAAFGL